MLTNDRAELIHLRAMVGGMRESMHQHPLSDFKTWAADMSAAGWYFHVWEGQWGKDAADGTTQFLTVEEAIALYADGETPNQKRLIGVTS